MIIMAVELMAAAEQLTGGVSGPNTQTQVQYNSIYTTYAYIAVHGEAPTRYLSPTYLANYQLTKSSAEVATF